MTVLWSLEVRVKVARAHDTKDKRSRHCPYLDTINRFEPKKNKPKQKSWLIKSQYERNNRNLLFFLTLFVGVFWTSILRSCAQSPSRTLTSMPVSSVENISKVESLYRIMNNVVLKVIQCSHWVSLSINRGDKLFFFFNPCTNRL